MSEVVVTVPEKATVADAASTMAREGVGCLIVTDENAIKGIVTDRDIVIRCVSERQDPVSSPIGKYVSSPVRSVRPTDDIVDAARLMAHARVKKSAFSSPGTPNTYLTPSSSRHLTNSSAAFMNAPY
jgi:CBS domain-containing protein